MFTQTLCITVNYSYVFNEFDVFIVFYIFDILLRLDGFDVLVVLFGFTAKNEILNIFALFYIYLTMNPFSFVL